jgi:hypothetical protein
MGGGGGWGGVFAGFSFFVREGAGVVEAGVALERRVWGLREDRGGGKRYGVGDGEFGPWRLFLEHVEGGVADEDLFAVMIAGRGG